MNLKEFVEITKVPVLKISRDTGIARNTIKRVLLGKKCLPQTIEMLDKYIKEYTKKLAKKLK